MTHFNKIASMVLAMAIAGISLTWAATPQEEVTNNYRRSASNHYAYPIPGDMDAPVLTAAPAGYEAFYIDHYGRHGSRWLTHADTYERPVKVLEHAHHAGVLTMQGERLLGVLRRVLESSRNRAGDLSDVGAEQHQGIAQRMFDNFPTVFAGDATVDARSTVILRCILSMQNETMTLLAANPRLRITTDASYHDMHYMGWGYGEDTLANPLRKRMDRITDSLYRQEVDPSRFIASIMDDTSDEAMHIDAIRLMRDVFDLAGNLQSHHEFDDLNLFYLFTNSEIFNLWRLKNIYWYVHWGNAVHNGCRMPFIERALLQDMVDKADAAIATGRHGADLRFGHETCVLPLACLMGIDNVAYATDDLDNLHEHWQDYNIIPKACNIQMVFYRPIAGDGDVLIKVLYNEHEATLPLEAVDFPYYRWSDVRERFLATIAIPTDWDAE